MSVRPTIKANRIDWFSYKSRHIFGLVSILLVEQLTEESAQALSTYKLKGVYIALRNQGGSTTVYRTLFKKYSQEQTRRN